jgi:putative transposase
MNYATRILPKLLHTKEILNMSHHSTLFSQTLSLIPRHIFHLYIFNSLSEVRDLTEDFVREYNAARPHESLGNLPPDVFAAQRAGASPCPLGAHLKPNGSFYL